MIEVKSSSGMAMADSRLFSNNVVCAFSELLLERFSIDTMLQDPPTLHTINFVEFFRMGASWKPNKVSLSRVQIYLQSLLQCTCKDEGSVRILA